MTCISLDGVCNGEKGKVKNKKTENLGKLFFVLILIDCSNGDDEGDGCNEINCPLFCQQNGKCVSLPDGPTCVCSDGYEYDQQSQRCEVIEEKN